MPTELEAMIAAAAAELFAAVEEACERSLVTPGGYGVLAEQSPDGAWRVKLSPDVPFQEVHYRHAQLSPDCL